MPSTPATAPPDSVTSLLAPAVAMGGELVVADAEEPGREPVPAGEAAEVAKVPLALG